MSKNAIKKITKALCSKYWFGGQANFPWKHPLNKVQNALAITMDGFIQYKFKVHKNGKLRMMEARSSRFLSLGLKPLQTVTVNELLNRIDGNTSKYES
jgi:hypothetical protein